MKAWLKALAGIAVLCSGCSEIVMDPLSAELPIGNIDGDDGQGGPEAAPNAIAMRMSQWTLFTPPGGVFEPGVVVATEPDDLVLFFGSHAQACAQPVLWVAPGEDPATCAAQAFWQTALILPAEQVQPGVVDLSDPSIGFYQAKWLGDCGGGSGYGMGLQGTLEIVSVGASSVEVKLALDPTSGWHEGNGDYTASFCP